MERKTCPKCNRVCNMNERDFVLHQQICDGPQPFTPTHAEEHDHANCLACVKQELGHTQRALSAAKMALEAAEAEIEHLTRKNEKCSVCGGDGAAVVCASCA